MNPALKKLLRQLMRLLPHASIVMSGMLITFFIIDRLNKPMGFMTNEFHKQLTFYLSLICILYSILIMAHQRKLDREAERARLERRRAQARREAAAQGAGRPYGPAQQTAAPARPPLPPRAAAQARPAAYAQGARPRPDASGSRGAR